MTNEEKAEICRLLRKETACGLATASEALDKLIEALKNQPPIVMDSPNCLNITWEQDSRLILGENKTLITSKEKGLPIHNIVNLI